MKHFTKHKFSLLLATSFFVISLFAITLPRGAANDAPPSDATACAAHQVTGVFDLTERLAQFEGRQVGVPEIAFAQGQTAVLGVASEERWIEVDLSEQKIKAWEGDTLFLEAPISSGLPWFNTPEGEFRIWIKLRATKMEGGEGRYYYYLPNVPYVMFFENEDVPGWKGYGLHGAYWHNDFGTPRSHGCVNLPIDVAGELYNWTSPVVPEGKWMVKATEDNPGTRIVIHE